MNITVYFYISGNIYAYKANKTLPLPKNIS